APCPPRTLPRARGTGRAWPGPVARGVAVAAAPPTSSRLRVPGGLRPLATLRRAVALLGEQVEPLAVADQAVAFPGQPFEDGRVRLERVDPRAQHREAVPQADELGLLALVLPLEPPQVDQAVLASENGEVRGRADQGRQQEAADPHATTPRGRDTWRAPPTPPRCAGAGCTSRRGPCGSRCPS